jgi:hypothetical protein
MAFINHPVEEPEKSLRDYASPQCEDIKVQESNSKLQASKYENQIQDHRDEGGNPVSRDGYGKPI